MLAAAVGTAADLDVEIGRQVDQLGRGPQVLLERLAEAARLRDRQLARLGAGATGDVGDRVGVGQAEAGGLEPGVQIGQAGAPDPAEDEVLHRGHAHRCRRRRRWPARPRTRYCSPLRSPSGTVTTALTKSSCFCGRTLVAQPAVVGAARRPRSAARGESRVRAARRRGATRRTISSTPGRRRCRRPRRRRLVGRRLDVERQLAHAFGPHLGQRGLERGAEPVPAHRLDQELHPVALPVLVVAALVEHADHRLGDAQQVLGRHEVDEHRRGGGHRRGAAADVDAEAAPAVLHLRQPADVVDGQLDVIARAALEGDLELARQRRRSAGAAAGSGSAPRRRASRRTARRRPRRRTGRR